MRERICSSASSTVSIRRYSTPRCSTLEGPRSGVVEQGCAPLARALRAPNGAGELVTGVRQVDDGLELAEEPAPGEHEEREEPGRDREVAGTEREPSTHGHRREDDEDTLEEDRHETEHGDHDQRRVPLGRPAGEALEQVRERDQPADDQHEPRQREPRLGEEAREKEARLHGDVAVPDHEVVGPEEVHPHDRDRELELRDVLHGGGRDRGVPARVRADRQEREETEPYIQGADDEVPAKQAAVPRGVERHHKVEAPQRDADDPEEEKDHARRNRLATVLLFLWVVTVSLWGFDLVMSLDPRWYSGLFGGYFAVSSLYTAFCLLALLTVRANARGLAAIPPAAVQDVAKLQFTMSIMWMYFFWSQYLVIWYGNVPVETRFFLTRFFTQPWLTLAWFVLVVGWLIPFAYLLKRLTGRPPQRHAPLVVVSVFGLVAIFLERVLVVFPSVSTSARLPFGARDLAITAGFLALFVLSRRWFFSQFKPVINLPHPGH